MDTNLIVRKLNTLKKQQSLTLKDLSVKSGISLGTLNKLMSGATLKIKKENICKLADAFGVTEEFLLQEEEIATAPTTHTESHFGMAKIACISPELHVGDCAFNTEQIIQRTIAACKMGVKIALFPELCITGYTCGDLFFHHTICESAKEHLLVAAQKLASYNVIAVVGLPLRADDGLLYNVAAVLYHGEVLAIVPKTNLPNYNEFEEKRTFVPFGGTSGTVTIGNKSVPFGTDIIFVNDTNPEMRFAIEICEDVWVSNSPSYRHAEAGALMILNLSASNETIVKSHYRRKLIEIQSGKTCSIYAYCSSGPSESTSATVFSAHNIICENGEILDESLPFASGYAEAEVDFNFIANERSRMAKTPQYGYETVHFELPLDEPTRVYSATPFVPQNPSEFAERAEMTLNILAHGLKKRVEHCKAAKLVIGVSGGSDSALALIICKRAMDLLGRPTSDILAYTMPCFGTSERTLANSVSLATAIGASIDEIDITNSVKLHLEDIGHDARIHNAAYENAQARERTQVLMDIANEYNGLVIGTGDMSEAALGWCTYNGDHMSMYNVNASVPKTLVKALLAYVAESAQPSLKRVLTDILATPVSPELLPPTEKDEISQITEDVIGPYELHDYFIFMLLRKGFSPSKVYKLALISFREKYDGATIYKWMNKFIRRFFSQQFKRSCAPDSVKLGSADFKTALHMPSDACAQVWLADLDKVLK